MYKRPRGVVLHRGPSELGGGDIVVIATFESLNTKTGNVITIWILPDGENPTQALRDGTNHRVCGTCGLQGSACYVDLSKAPNSVAKSDVRRNYPDLEKRIHAHYFYGRVVRFGGYGDPAAIPLDIIKWVAKTCRAFVGYSSQLFWIDRRRANALAKFLMCSCHNLAQHEEAERRGWRSYTVIPENGKAPAGSIECPHTKKFIRCESCLLCCGTSKKAKSIYVHAHGKGRKQFNQLATER